MMMPRIQFSCFCLCCGAWAGFSTLAAPAPLETPAVHLRLEGEVGARLDAVVENWLLTAPLVNPGMIEMMRLRDRTPAYEDPVPWAGEFIGKYLTSAILSLRMTEDAALRGVVEATLADLLSTQAEDGYLGPFPKKERLLGHWDLWGHYHAIYALWLWHRDTGDTAALEAAYRAADLVCTTYLDTEKRVHDAGAAEMNMAIMHALGLLYRESGRDRYLRMMREVLKDMERPPAGDYFRLAETGMEFYETPKPRWESLHPMLGLGEFYRITGEEAYKNALLHWWRSIRKTDVHNAGSFSTREQAVGNPFMPGPIETCCTVAWVAYSVEALRLAQDSQIADALELALWNAVLGYTHPSGRWCTYDTPMDGKRQASAHSIVFQARPGTPELNCCSVNGPRGLSLLSDWAVLEGAEGIYLNYYGPGSIDCTLSEGGLWRFEQATAYPKAGAVQITVTPETPTARCLFLRIPAWSKDTGLRVNGAPAEAVTAGSYCALDRTWRPGDVIQLDLDMGVHALRGDRHVDYKTSLYSGPILLAYDQSLNTLDPAELPALDFNRLTLKPAACASAFQPMVLFEVRGEKDTPFFLCDYATAGAHGAWYASWLRVDNAPPAPFAQVWPCNTARLPLETTCFLWDAAEAGASYTLDIAEDGAFTQPVLAHETAGCQAELDLTAHRGKPLYWRVTAEVEGKRMNATNSPCSFTLDPDLPASAQGSVLEAGLAGKPNPETGTLQQATAVEAGPGPEGANAGALLFDGATSKLTYAAPSFPLRTYTFSAWFQPSRIDAGDSSWRHLFSAWAKSSDDPLRVSVKRGRLEVNIEQQGQHYHLEGPELAPGVWRHVAVVKQRDLLLLYLDGKRIARCRVPLQLSSTAKNLGIGCNPNYSKPEVFEGALARVRFSREALNEETICKLAQP